MKHWSQLPRKATDYIILHGSSACGLGDAKTTRDIDLAHRRAGFFRIGFHLVILPDGSFSTAREMNVIGAHCQGYNARSLGVCLIGGEFTEPQFTTLATILRDWRVVYPDAAIVAHRDLEPNCECPGFDVKAWLAERNL